MFYVPCTFMYRCDQVLCLLCHATTFTLSTLVIHSRIETVCKNLLVSLFMLYFSLLIRITFLMRVLHSEYYLTINSDSIYIYEYFYNLIALLIFQLSFMYITNFSRSIILVSTDNINDSNSLIFEHH